MLGPSDDSIGTDDESLILISVPTAKFAHPRRTL